jgi:hypothetical protein
VATERKTPKEFVPASYSRSNAWAIEQVEKLLKHQGYAILPKSEDYGPDIKAEKDSIIELYEVETKTGYAFNNQEDFRFSTVSFLARKEKWKDLGFWYVIICRETSAYIKCHSSIIFQDKFRVIKKIDAAERVGKDIFYQVPKDLCEWLTLNND